MIRQRDVWRDVPDAEILKQKLRVAQSESASLMDRQNALGYLTGAAKVLSKIEARVPLATHLKRQVQDIKRSLYYARGEAHEQDHG